MKALVIDDSDLARGRLRALLERTGMQVFEQPSAIGATRNIIRHSIDVAVVDVSMPGLSGDKLVGILRKKPRLRGLVIVVVSAKPWSELEAIAERTEADAVFSKDDVETLLLEFIAKVQAGAQAISPGAGEG